MALIYLDPTGKLRPNGDDAGQGQVFGLPPDGPPPPMAAPMPPPPGLPPEAQEPPGAPAAAPQGDPPPREQLHDWLRSRLSPDQAALYDPQAMSDAQARDRSRALTSQNVNGMLQGAFSAARMAPPRPEEPYSESTDMLARRKALEEALHLGNEERQADLSAVYRDAMLGERSRHDQATEDLRGRSIDEVSKRNATYAEHLSKITAKSGGAGGIDPVEKQIGDGIMSGILDPSGKGLYKHNAGVQAYLAGKGFDLARAQGERVAYMAQLKTLNGSQIQRVSQAVNNSYHQLGVLESLRQEWEKAAGDSDFRVLNRANLELAKQGKGPPELGAIAQALEGQTSDLVAELASIYQNGNSPTAETIGMAKSNIDAAWNSPTFDKGLGLIRTNLAIRQNALLNSGVGGFPNGTRYDHRDGSPSPDGKPKHDAAPPAGAGDTVDVMWKGKAKTIKRSQLPEALKAGATEIKHG